MGPVAGFCRIRRRPRLVGGFFMPLPLSHRRSTLCSTRGRHDDTEPRRRQAHRPEHRRPCSAPSPSATAPAPTSHLSPRDYDGDVRSHTIARWVHAGNADIRNGNNATGYVRFAKIYKDRLKEQGGGEANRTRELDHALEILARTCECGNEKMLL